MLFTSCFYYSFCFMNCCSLQNSMLYVFCCVSSSQKYCGTIQVPLTVDGKAGAQMMGLLWLQRALLRDVNMAPPPREIRTLHEKCSALVTWSDSRYGIQLSASVCHCQLFAVFHFVACDSMLCIYENPEITIIQGMLSSFAVLSDRLVVRP